MIIKNGTIQILTATGERTETPDGDPVKIDPTQGPEIDCSFKQMTYRQYQYEGGITKLSRYEILIDMQPFTGTRVRLINSQRQTVGDFEILNVELLNVVNRVKITV